MVSDSVVHATAESIWRNGLRETGRGAGTPVRPPHVCLKRTYVSVTSGSGRMSGIAFAFTVIELGPSLSLVTPSLPPPPWPQPVTLPASPSIPPPSAVAPRQLPPRCQPP